MTVVKVDLSIGGILAAKKEAAETVALIKAGRLEAAKIASDVAAATAASGARGGGGKANTDFEIVRIPKQARADRLRGRDLDGVGIRNKVFGAATSLREKTNGARGIFSGRLDQVAPGALVLAEGVPALGIAGIGPIATIAAAVIAVVATEVNRVIDLRLADAAKQIQANIDKALFEADFAKRLKEDPAFAREQAQIIMKRERAIAGSGFVRRGDGIDMDAF